jgi:hypothetical protein
VSSCKRVTNTISIVMSYFNVIRVTNNLCHFSPNGTKFAYCFGNELTIRNTVTFEQCHTFSCVDIVDVSTHCHIYE